MIQLPISSNLFVSLSIFGRYETKTENLWRSINGNNMSSMAPSSDGRLNERNIWNQSIELMKKCFEAILTNIRISVVPNPVNVFDSNYIVRHINQHS